MNTHKTAEIVSLSTDRLDQSSPFRVADRGHLLGRWPANLTAVHDRLRKALPVPALRIVSDFSHGPGGLTHQRTCVMLDQTDDLAARLDPDWPTMLATVLPAEWGDSRTIRVM